MRAGRFCASAVSLALALASGHAARADSSLSGARKHIKHVIVVMLENRSFDHYFDRFPGADGPPAGVCNPYDLANRAVGCLAPYPEPRDSLVGGPHGAVGQKADINAGAGTSRMDGFLDQPKQAMARR